MLTWLFRILFVFLPVVPALTAAEQADPAIPDDGFVPGWERVGVTQTFTKNDLYGHIDGGAELFLEFGFEKLLVQKYKNGDDEIDLEMYLMTEPDAALGIYLMKCGKESPSSMLPCRNSINQYQFTLVCDNAFIQVNNFSGSEKLRPVMYALAESAGLAAKTFGPAEEESLFDYLPEKDLYRDSKLLIRGPFALQPIYTFGEGDILQLKGKVFGVVGDYAAEDQTTYTMIIIPYPDAETAAGAFQNLNDNLDSYLEVVEQSERVLVFKDYLDKFGQAVLDGNILRIKINLSEKP